MRSPATFYRVILVSGTKKCKGNPLHFLVIKGFEDPKKKEVEPWQKKIHSNRPAGVPVPG